MVAGASLLLVRMTCSMAWLDSEALLIFQLSLSLSLSFHLLHFGLIPVSRRRRLYFTFCQHFPPSLAGDDVSWETAGNVIVFFFLRADRHFWSASEGAKEIPRWGKKRRVIAVEANKSQTSSSSLFVLSAAAVDSPWHATSSWLASVYTWERLPDGSINTHTHKIPPCILFLNVSNSRPQQMERFIDSSQRRHSGPTTADGRRRRRVRTSNLLYHGKSYSAGGNRKEGKAHWNRDLFRVTLPDLKNKKLFFPPDSWLYVYYIVVSEYSLPFVPSPGGLM